MPLCGRSGRKLLIGAAHHLSLHATPAGTRYGGFKPATINVRLRRRLAPRNYGGITVTLLLSLGRQLVDPANLRMTVGNLLEHIAQIGLWVCLSVLPVIGLWRRHSAHHRRSWPANFLRASAPTIPGFEPVGRSKSLVGDDRPVALIARDPRTMSGLGSRTRRHAAEHRVNTSAWLTESSRELAIPSPP